MWQNNNPALRSIWFLFRTAIVALLLAGVLWFAYGTAKQSAHVYIIAFEGLTDRADSILNASKQQYQYDLTSFFSEQELDADQMIKQDPYQDYDVTSYDYTVHVEAVYAFPWSRTATVRLREIVSRIDGKVLESVKLENPDIETNPPQWQPYRYEVKLTKTVNGKWLIYDMEKIEEVPPVTPLLTALSLQTTPSPDPG